ncbi:MAG: hypothetical protein PHO14_09150 [Kiritimatiellae bacterium]|jgi:hypothetical protein|nr:hypothetical protein [Kiritimatiellia bacterium]MDD4342383.1 hypothetical protein [Kiritimatiellia bacterium]MDY0149789.1 hypothetical protein [Kiritimatiellia bacterium]
MKRYALVFAALCALTFTAAAQVQPPDDPVGQAVAAYFAAQFDALKTVADRQPTRKSFRAAMKPLAEQTSGFFGGSFIDTNFVIREVYYPRDFLARGFDLKKVKQLDYFWGLMRENPTPQLSEPGHGNIIQPRLIAMRYPVINDGTLDSIVSYFVRTESFLKAVGLDQVKGYRITCRGVLAENGGKLGTDPKIVTITLPANEWLIEYAP